MGASIAELFHGLQELSTEVKSHVRRGQEGGQGSSIQNLLYFPSNSALILYRSPAGNFSLRSLKAVWELFIGAQAYTPYSSLFLPPPPLEFIK